MNSSFSKLFLVLKAADKCLLAFNRSKSKGKQKAKEEISSLFNKKLKARSNCLWKHKFYCLAFHDQRRIPTTDCEKDDLYKQALERKILNLMI